MGAVNSVGSLVAHVRSLSSVSPSSRSLRTNHLSSILHTNNVNVVLIRAVRVDWCERLAAAVGGSRASVASSALRLHVPRGASRSGIPLPVLHTLTLREAGRVRAILGIFISNSRRSEHVLWCAARAMPTKLIISLVGPEVSFILDLNRNTFLVSHAGTPLTPGMLTILLVQQRHRRTICEHNRLKILTPLQKTQLCVYGSQFNYICYLQFTQFYSF